MKRLTRQERIGAIILAIISLLLIGGGFFITKFNNEDKKDSPKVTVIYAPEERVTAKSSNESRNKRTNHNKKSVAREYRCRKASKINPVEKYELRDLLSDSITMKYNYPQD